MSTNTMYIYWLDTESTEFRTGEERAKETFYTCLRNPPAKKSAHARFVVVQRKIEISNQYTDEEINKCNDVTECIGAQLITFQFV